MSVRGYNSGNVRNKNRERNSLITQSSGPCSSNWSPVLSTESVRPVITNKFITPAHVNNLESVGGTASMPASLPIINDFEIEEDEYPYINETYVSSTRDLVNPWNAVPPEQIYDKFQLCGARLGIVANRIIKILVDMGHLSNPNNGNRRILAKTKKDKERDRSEFQRMSVGGVQVLRDFMFDEGILVSENMYGAAGGNDDVEYPHLTTSEESINLQARAVHLAIEEETMVILEQIFACGSLVPKAARRQLLDDKKIETIHYGMYLQIIITIIKIGHQ